MPMAVEVFTDLKGTVRSRPCFTMSVRGNTDIQPVRVDLFRSSGEGRKSRGDKDAKRTWAQAEQTDSGR